MKKVVKYLLICFFTFFVVATTWTWSKAKTNALLNYVTEETESEGTEAEGMEGEEMNDSDSGADSWQYEEADPGEAGGGEEADSYQLDF